MTAILPNMLHRQILQRMLSGEWKTLIQLGVAVGEGLLVRMIKHGWIEQRGIGKSHEIKITPAGFEAMRARIPPDKKYPRPPRARRDDQGRLS
jgi:hypothetical protein